jgi:superfamily I DNA/RNA helicase
VGLITDPNKQQQQLIDGTDGIYLVDAGAGTGKTFTITRRYLRLLDEGFEPEQIFLCTFTRNAAEEMSERVVEKTDLDPSRIYEAPISTFHSHCQKILEKHGFKAPEILGIDDNITGDISMMESQIRERQEFEEFFETFRQEKTEYGNFYAVVKNESELLDLVKSLAAKGVIPEKNGWFGNTEKYLDGDKERFTELFKEANKPVKNNGNNQQSRLRGRLNSMRYKDYPEDAPEVNEVRGGYGTKTVRRDFAEKAFEEDREELKQFIHDIYFEYLKYCLSRNYLNFSFLMMFTYILLYKNKQVRREESFKHLMIDEFQDTNEIQFKLTLLLAGKPNICVVGDWKQSIYSFQYASVENIQKFEERLQRYCSELNSDEIRIPFDIGEVEDIKLKMNYRSTQDILDFSERSLELPGNRYEQVEEPEITSLESQKTGQESVIRKLMTENEPEAVLAKIQQIVDNEEFLYEEDSEERKMDYGDIAVLTRTRSFGLELQELAREYGIPVAYEGGVELFKTNPAIMLLAWLRILNSNSDKGWAVALEKAGYNLDEAEYIINTGHYPSNMQSFCKKLEEMDRIGAVARKVFTRYGYASAFTEKIVEILENTFDSSFMNTSQLIRFIEENIEEGEIYQIDSSKNQNTVKIQTIHAVKGLEYPCVFISDVNYGKFPSNSSSRSPIIFRDPIGLRQKKLFRNGDYAFNYDNWRTEILTKALTGDYDEERRLMYVAMTRAEQHLFVSAENDRESYFFSELEAETEEVDAEPEQVSQEEEVLDEFRFVSSDRKRPEKVHIGDEFDKQDAELQQRHNALVRFAEQYVNGEAEPEDELQQEVTGYLDDFDGEAVFNRSVSIPITGSNMVYTGEIDLLFIGESSVEVVELRPESHQENISRYREKMRYYRKAVESCYPSKDVNCRVFFP